MYNLPYGMQDGIDVNQLLHDGLGMLYVKTVTRAPSVNNYRAGVFTMNRSEQQ